MSSPGGQGCWMGPVANRINQSIRYACKSALIRAKTTKGSYINPMRKFGESRGARFCGVMNYGNLYSGHTGFRSVRLLF